MTEGPKPHTLNEALTAAGWRTVKGTHGQGHHVYTRAGEYLGQLTAQETWDALRASGLVRS